MKTYLCYVCHAQPCEGYSAYCAACQPAVTRAAPVGKLQSICAGCTEVFTTPRNFDIHQTYANDKLTCKDPRKMFNRERKRRMVLTTRGWAKNPELTGFNTFERKDRV